MPHGGPIGVFDHRYFDLDTLFLASKGFAVLRVNFRGSGGHSKALEDAGEQQWGNLMLVDIKAATDKVITRDDIDADHVCVFGMSYGGYAATMLAMQHPERYRCAISYAGVTDLNLYLNAPELNKRQDAWLRKQCAKSTIARL
jgi:dipeptidyl aminopeptidase/acylaminoacyl peptidase